MEDSEYDRHCLRTGLESSYKGGMLQMVHVSEGVVFRTLPLPHPRDYTSNIKTVISSIIFLVFSFF